MRHRLTRQLKKAITGRWGYAFRLLGKRAQAGEIALEVMGVISARAEEDNETCGQLHKLFEDTMKEMGVER